MFGEPLIVAIVHDEEIEDKENAKLGNVEDVSRSGYHESILIQDRGKIRTVDGDGFLLVMVGYDVDEGGGCIDDAADIDGVHDLLTGGRADQ